MNSSDFEFIFIIGAARSGTKYLRDLVSLDNRTAMVPYDVNFIWRYGLDSVSSDEIGGELADQNRRRRIRSNLIRASNAKNQSEIKRIVEKTVSNSLRVEYVQKLFPEARFVYLVRDGRAVAESARRMWRAPADWRYLAGKALRTGLRNPGYYLWFLANIFGPRVWGPRYEGIAADLERVTLLEVCALQWRACVDAMARDAGKIAPSQLFQLSYEDLSSPETVAQLAEFLNLDSASILTAHGARFESKNLEKWRDVLKEQEIAKLNTLLQPQLARYGYPNE